jgi:hypothetical protein
MTSAFGMLWLLRTAMISYIQAVAGWPGQVDVRQHLLEEERTGHLRRVWSEKWYRICLNRCKLTYFLGEQDSNTFFYEHALNWSGLLVEVASNEIAGIKGLNLNLFFFFFFFFFFFSFDFFPTILRLERRKSSLVLHGAICDKRSFVNFKINDGVMGLSGQVEHDTNRYGQCCFFFFFTYLKDFRIFRKLSQKLRAIRLMKV